MTIITPANEPTIRAQFVPALGWEVADDDDVFTVGDEVASGVEAGGV